MAERYTSTRGGQRGGQGRGRSERGRRPYHPYRESPASNRSQTDLHHRGEVRGGRDARQNSDRSPLSSRGHELPSKRPKYSQRTLEVADSVSTSSTNSSKHIAEELQPTSSLLPCTKASVNPTAVMPIGTIGRKIMLRANLFTVNISDDLGYIHRYDTQIIPKAPRKVNVTVIDKMVNDNLAIFGRQKVAYDGQKNLYVCKSLNGISAQNEGKITVSILLPDEIKEKKFEITIKKTEPGEISLDILQQVLSGRLSADANIKDFQEAIQVLDIIMKQLPYMRHTSVGRSYFTSRSLATSLGGGKVVWFGYFQSVRPVKWKMALNVNISAKAFYKEQSVLQFMEEVLRPKNLHRLDERQRLQFLSEIKGVKVRTKHTGYKKVVRGLSLKSASEQSFPLGDSKDVVTIEKYFKDKYKIVLHYPGLPCLRFGEKEKHNYIPIELCDIVAGQHVMKRLKDFEQSKMVRNTALSAPETEQRILKEVEQAEFNKDPFLKEFGINVSTKMMYFEGRVLPPQILQFKNGELEPHKGTWKMDYQKFYLGATINTWGVIVINPSQMINEKARDFATCFKRIAEELGMSITSSPTITSCRGTMEDVKTTYRNKLNGSDFVFAIVDYKGCPEYGVMKQFGDKVCGIPTQCVLKSTLLDKSGQATLVNICLKVNAKLGGVNLIIPFRPQLFKKPVLIMGADVTHPSPADKTSPSIGAVVGSIDLEGCRYCSSNIILRHRQEVMEVKQMGPKVMYFLNLFYKTTEHKPQAILFFRDGVSEGQFDAVRLNEIGAIQEACQRMEDGYRPPITFLTVQKRHHIRLFAQNKRDQIGKSGNVPAGTVVDTDITNPVNCDFLLVSHTGIQGTSHPCKYKKLWDDNDLSVDDIEILSYQLCHVYSRSLNSVSIPAPTYYAHHSALKARQRLDQLLQSESESTASESSVICQPSLEDMEAAIEVADRMKWKMHFL